MNQPAPVCAHGLIGESPQIDAIRRLIEKFARNRLPILLTGESGTGKEVVARAIYNTDPRGEFVTIDCGSLVGTLAESELFGHVKGSFTSATEHKKGLVEGADQGTVFLDEIGDLPLETQVKLLRLIQEGEYRPVGSTNWRKLDLRIIAATHRDLKEEAKVGRFRRDLFYRLNVFSIRLPPLRQRMQDVPPLVEHFLRGRPTEQPTFRPSEQVMKMLLNYNWPGNVRELKHCIERLTALNSEPSMQILDLPSPFQNHFANADLQRLSVALAASTHEPPIAAPILTIQESERQTIARALEAANGQRARAAELLNMSRTTLYRRMKQYKIE